MMSATFFGVLAAVLTTLSYVPQIVKCFRTGKSADLSLGMFSILSGGIACWIVYGVLRDDMVLIVANSLSLACLALILSFKMWPAILRRRR